MVNEYLFVCHQLQWHTRSWHRLLVNIMHVINPEIVIRIAGNQFAHAGQQKSVR